MSYTPRRSSYFHHMHMHRLSPGTRYYYQYGSADGPGGFSEEHMFVAPPIPGSNVTTKILAFGGEAECVL